MSNSVFYRICTAFEVKVRTQALCAIDLTEVSASGAAAEAAATTANKLFTTKEANACVLTALLLCLVPV